MILTVTLSPSVDISYKLDDFKLDATNRCNNTIKTAGGKGLNVARVLKFLGAELIATGFLGGDLGNFVKEQLDKDNIKNDFLFTDKPTRNCIAILSNNQQTEILEYSEVPNDEYLAKFLKKYELLCDKVNVVCISGSSPKGLDNSYVENLVKIAKEKNCTVITDVSGKLLEDVVNNFSTKPDFIKPNQDEFKDLLDKSQKLKEDFDIKASLKNDINQVDNVIVSLSADGAIVKSSDRLYKVDIPKIKVVNPVGSGDSSVAGLAYGIDNEMSFEDALKLSNACGMSNAMNQKTGYIDLEVVKDLQQQIKVSSLN